MNKLKVLVACEFSGIVRDAFLRRGHDAISCDLLPTESPGPHYQGDVLNLLYSANWDLMIAHPPCTYLCNSGARWLHERPERWNQLNDAAKFFKLLHDAPIDKIAIENPIMHHYGTDLIGGLKPSQRIQPWQFGHGECKTICLYLKNLPLLVPTNIVDGREHKVWKSPDSKGRSKKRSIFYKGIAEAMANQWG